MISLDQLGTLDPHRWTQSIQMGRVVLVLWCFCSLRMFLIDCWYGSSVSLPRPPMSCPSCGRGSRAALSVPMLLRSLMLVVIALEATPPTRSWDYRYSSQTDLYWHRRSTGGVVLEGLEGRALFILPTEFMMTTLSFGRPRA